MNAYDLVKKVLEEKPYTRSSDKHLLWEVWFLQGCTSEEYDDAFRTEIIKKGAWLNRALTPETVTRARRKVQEQHPELCAEKAVEDARRKREEKGGNFIFSDEGVKECLENSSDDTYVREEVKKKAIPIWEQGKKAIQMGMQSVFGSRS